ncbi:MAG: response regulator transcription factor [Chloroflexi bacterium]|nr:MAG: response regulator transcription factor [Chloroflexota bacterium]
MRVILADDSVLIREGLASVLREAGFDVVAQAEDATSLIQAVDAGVPDVCVVDIRMPPSHTTEGLIAALEIRKRHPTVGVLVLSQHVETYYAMQLLGGGASGVGYLLKERLSDVREVADAIRQVAAGRSVIDPTVVSRLIQRRRMEDPIETLSSREREVLGLVAEGRSNRAIGERLFLSPKTVEAHVSSIFSKLGITDTPDDNRRILSVLAWLRA